MNTLVVKMGVSLNNSDLPTARNYLYNATTTSNAAVESNLPPAGTQIYFSIVNLDESFGFTTAQMINSSNQVTKIIDNERAYPNQEVTGNGVLIENCIKVEVTNPNNKNLRIQIWY